MNFWGVNEILGVPFKHWIREHLASIAGFNGVFDDLQTSIYTV